MSLAALRNRIQRRYEGDRGSLLLHLTAANLALLFEAGQSPERVTVTRN
jgi:hypothetical protein